jgi:hypothetical protein
MTKNEVCQLLGISKRTFERRIKAGQYRRSSGIRAEFSLADLGLSEPSPPEPLPAALPITQAGLEPEPEPVRTPAADGGIAVADLDEMSTEELRAALTEWRKPSDPNGCPTNAPSEGSSTMPTALNFARVTRANAILLTRSFTGFTPKHDRYPRRAFNAPAMLGTGEFAYRPATGYGVTQEDLDAESNLLKERPNFARNRYSW